LPFQRKEFEAAIDRSGVSVTSSLKAFAAGFDAATNLEPAVETVSKTAPKPGPALEVLASRIATSFPAPSHTFLVAGIQRLADYQNIPYATTYLDRLEPIRDFDRRNRAENGKGDCALLTETARYLALWMSYEDAIRVADLKTRRARFERVRSDARVTSGQLLLINEFLHPRVEEFADILPAGVGSWLLRTGWATRLINHLTHQGKILQTTSLSGFLQLYLLASLRRWRPKTLRFKREQQRINHWLERVEKVAQSDYALALEVAECPRLIKGYGETYVQGKYIRPAWEAPWVVRRDHPQFTHVIPGGSPRNPMGAAAITLGRSEVAIHGTTASMRRSVGTAASYGCIRMYNEDVVDLFGRVAVGTPVVAIP